MMAVKTVYVVERGDKEVMSTVNKKEADAYDKMLDISDELFDLIQSNDVGVKMEESELEELCIYLSKNKEVLSKLLRGQKLEKEPLTEKNKKK